MLPRWLLRFLQHAALLLSFTATVPIHDTVTQLNDGSAQTER
jgi:hypothetical protein